MSENFRARSQVSSRLGGRRRYASHQGVASELFADVAEAAAPMAAVAVVAAAKPIATAAAPMAAKAVVAAVKPIATAAAPLKDAALEVPQVRTAVMIGAAGVAVAFALVGGVKMLRRRNEATRVEPAVDEQTDEQRDEHRHDEPEEQPTTDVFVSYTHADKTIARRVARRLQALGLSVWLDENELRVGDRLSPTIESHIRASRWVLVVATKAAAKAPWVRDELAFAERQPSRIQIYALCVEPVKDAPLFKHRFALDATDRHYLEKHIIEAAERLAGAPLPPPSADHLRDGLTALKSEEPVLSPLIEACLAGGGQPQAGAWNVQKASFDALDFALNALYDIAVDEKQQQLIAGHAAHFFSLTGAGAYALERYVRQHSGSDVVLESAVGRRLRADELNAALHLLELTDPRDDQALEGFIRCNGNALSPAQRAAVVHLVTWPERGPGGSLEAPPVRSCDAFARMRT